MIKLSQDKEVKRRLSEFENIHIRIKDLRDGRDSKATKNLRSIKQNAISEIFNMPAQNWNKIEKGKKNGGNNPTIEHLIGMSVYWGVSIDYIVTGEAPLSSIQNQSTTAQSNLDDSLKIKFLEEKLIDKDAIISSLQKVVSLQEKIIK
ncbi:MAG: hypothetical protein RIF36_02670 [Imperialibacter sp.]|uniref:hypothetical protein n=1 Tax=Imperialibacter sp. TaxID=2038411 RepID=UPI0032EF76E3